MTLMMTATEIVRNLGPVSIGPLKAKVMTVSKANVALEVTNPLVKEDLEQRLVEALGAISGMMKSPNNEVLTQG